MPGRKAGQEAPPGARATRWEGSRWSAIVLSRTLAGLVDDDDVENGGAGAELAAGQIGHAQVGEGLRVEDPDGREPVSRQAHPHARAADVVPYAGDDLQAGGCHEEAVQRGPLRGQQVNPGRAGLR